MNHRHRLLMLALLALAACGSVETQPEDPRVFAAAGYSRYAWRNDPLPEPENYRDTRRQVLDASLRSAVDERLGELGYRRVPRQRAQFLVDYFAAAGIVDGRLSRNANNVTPLPSGTINRQINQAEVDNAYALAGARTTGNVALVFLGGDLQPLWSVRISTLVEDANRVDPGRVRRAMRRGLQSLPPAPDGD